MILEFVSGKGQLQKESSGRKIVKGRWHFQEVSCSWRQEVEEYKKGMRKFRKLHCHTMRSEGSRVMCCEKVILQDIFPSNKQFRIAYKDHSFLKKRSFLEKGHSQCKKIKLLYFHMTVKIFHFVIMPILELFYTCEERLKTILQHPSVPYKDFNLNHFGFFSEIFIFMVTLTSDKLIAI